MAESVHRKIVAVLSGLVLLGAAVPVQAAGSFEQLPVGEKVATVGVLLLVVICTDFGLLALLLVYSLLRPAAIRRGSALLRAHPKRSLFAGVLGLVVSGVLFALLQAFPDPVRAVGSLILVAFLIYLLVSGAATVTYDLGDRLLTNVGAKAMGSSFMAVFWGTVLLLTLGLLPVLGALILFVVTVLAFGVALSGLGRHPVPSVVAEGGAQSDA